MRNPSKIYRRVIKKEKYAYKFECIKTKIKNKLQPVAGLHMSRGYKVPDCGDQTFSLLLCINDLLLGQQHIKPQKKNI